MSRGLIVPVTPAEAAARARSLIGLRLPPPANKPGPILAPVYKLGAGGKSPLRDHPFDWLATGRWAADCSATLCWAWGADRLQEAFPGRWLNTDALLREARAAAEWVQIIDVPEVGCGVVYGGTFRNGNRIRVGHCGLVTKVPAEYDEALNADDVRVVHCSSSASKRGHAISEAGASLWLKKGGVYLRWVRTG